MDSLRRTKSTLQNEIYLLKNYQVQCKQATHTGEASTGGHAYHVCYGTKSAGLRPTCLRGSLSGHLLTTVPATAPTPHSKKLVEPKGLFHLEPKSSLLCRESGSQDPRISCSSDSKSTPMTYTDLYSTSCPHGQIE